MFNNIEPFLKLLCQELNLDLLFIDLVRIYMISNVMSVMRICNS